MRDALHRRPFPGARVYAPVPSPVLPAQAHDQGTDPGSVHKPVHTSPAGHHGHVCFTHFDPTWESPCPPLRSADRVVLLEGAPCPLLDSQGCPGRQPPPPTLDKCKGVRGGSVGVSLCWVPAVPWHPPGDRNQNPAGLRPRRQPVSMCLRALPRAWLRCSWAVRVGGDSRPPRSLALGSAGPGAGPGQPEGGFPLHPQEGPVCSHEPALWDAGPGPCGGYVPAALQLQHQRGHWAAAGLHRGPRARTQVRRLLGPPAPLTAPGAPGPS